MTPETLNLAFHEKRLITKALIKAKGNPAQAYKINVPCGYYISYRTYLRKIYDLYKIDIKGIKNNTNKKLKTRLQG